MNWFSETLTEHTYIQAIIIISSISAIGLFLGKRKILGISLGITFVFFSGIIAGHFGVVVNNEMLAFAQNFGLIIFVYALGLQVGPGFFSSLKKGGVALNMMSVGVIILGLLMTLVMHWVTGISLSNMMGMLCGAVTNTPALGAAQQALEQLSPGDTRAVTDMALACAVTYPLGVLGVILAIVILKSVFIDKNLSDETEKRDKSTFVAEFLVCNPVVYNKKIREIVHLSDKRFVITRVWRNGRVSVPTSETQILQGDHLLVISEKGNIESIKVLFGCQESTDWNKEDVDWNAIDSQLISRRIFVSQEEVNGVKIGTLRLRNTYGINITRINRAGIDLLASPDLRLQIGDRITVVGEAAAIEQVVKILGDELKRLDTPNLTAVFIGIMLGVLLGSLPIAIPGISTPVKLGIAGGPIIVGILMGAFGPRFHFTTYTTQSANLMMRQFGIVIYLACLGLTSGAHFFETIFRAEGALWICLGFLLTIVPVLIVGYIASRIFKLDYASNVGMLCGSMANPMALSYANSTVPGDEPSVSYATVYPLAMFVRVISAQIILILFS